MKRSQFVLAIVMAICLTAGVFAQGIPIEVMPILKTGAIFTAGGATEFGFGAGANIDIYRDSASGFATYTYLGKFFSGRGENNIEFSTSFLYVEKYFPNFKGDFKPYIAIGAGYVHDGKAAYSLDLGGVIYHQVGLSLGSWYAPESDEVFVSLNINLTP